MSILLVIGIVLVLAAAGLLGFVLLQNRKAKTADTEQPPLEEAEDDRAVEQLSADYVLSPSAGDNGTATSNFFILCTVTFWVLLLGACYWAYSSRPIHGLIVACGAILVYSLVLIMQEVLKNLIRLNENLGNETGEVK